MARLDAAIDVATEYAYHLYKVDGVPQAQAITIGAAAVVRAARANPSKFVTARAQPQPESALGWSGAALAAVGSTLSAIGWLKTLFGGG
jgi:hypothetical protein